MASARGPARVVLALLLLLLLLAGGAMVASVARTSTTFDEIVLVSSGARGLETGDWSMVVDQPPLMPLLYGLPVWMSRPSFPDEGDRSLGYDDRWDYARDLYFQAGNDPRRLAWWSRCVAVTVALGLILVAFGMGRWIGGREVGLAAAALTALFPDVLAHGAIAYNDVPLALTYMAALWGLDVAVRRPCPKSGAVAGGLVALAMGVKFSAVALGPAALVLAGLQAMSRGRDPDWWRGLAKALGGALLTGYLVTVVLYRGDPWLIWLEQGLRYTAQHAAAGHPAPAWLLGRTSPDGWWYFFPVSLILKTPVALHALVVAAAVGLWRSAGTPWHASRLRAPAVGCVVFLAFLVTSSLNVGTRYALPAWVLLLVLVAAGVARFLAGAGSLLRITVLALGVLYGASTLSAWPHFLAYTSEWTWGRGPGREALLDSSVDWGQGLVALRDFQLQETTGPVRLSYFGSGLPSAYGVEYVALPSFLALPPSSAAGPGGSGGGNPEDAGSYTVISITNLHGLYLDGDPFAGYRTRAPDRILAGTLYVYREETGAGR